MVVINKILGNEKYCAIKHCCAPIKALDAGTFRDCDIKFSNCSNPRFKCRALAREFLKSLYKVLLDKISSCKIGKLVFDAISFGAKNMESIVALLQNFFIFGL